MPSHSSNSMRPSELYVHACTYMLAHGYVDVCTCTGHGYVGVCTCTGHGAHVLAMARCVHMYWPWLGVCTCTGHG